MIKRINSTTVNKTNPAWRYQLLKTPGKQGFSHCLSLASSKGGKGLLRYITNLDLDITVEWTPSNEIKQIQRSLSKEDLALFNSLIVVHCKRKKPHRSGKLPDKHNLNFPLWSIKEASKLNDSFFVRLVKHAANLEFDHYIATALKLYNNPEREESLRFIGYNFYAKKPDTEIAKAWSMPVRVIEALRLLFYDFSSFPKERLANFTCLRQMVVNGYISDLDFAFYKRIYELGDLGLKAQIDFNQLTTEEKSQVNDYLNESYTSNVFNLNFSIQNKKDTSQYLSALGSLAEMSIKKKEVELVSAKIKNLNAATRRIDTESTNMETNMTSIDQDFIELLRQNSLKEVVPTLKTIADLM